MRHTSMTEKDYRDYSCFNYKDKLRWMKHASCDKDNLSVRVLSLNAIEQKDRKESIRSMIVDSQTEG